MNFFNLSFAPKKAPVLTTMSEPKPQSRSVPQLPPPPPPEPAFVLHKQRSWSPDIDRDKEWSRLKRKQLRRQRSSCSVGVTVTDDDLKELKGCIDLGFGFDTPNLDPKLSRTFPALEMYSAVKKSLSRSSSSVSSESESSGSSPSLSDLLDQIDGPEKMKVKLRQWAQVVACSVREASMTKLEE